ncbi:MAG: DUF2878 family protein [Bdellovibrionales bacterium]
MTTTNLKKSHQITLFAMTYFGWFACVFAGKFQLDLLAYFVPAIFLFLLHRFSGLNRNVLLAFGLLTIIGISFDSLALKMGWIKLINAEVLWGVPHWLAALWLLFVFSVPLYSGWLLKRRLFTAVLGFFLGPITYFSGSAFEVLLIEQKLHLLIYGFFWAAFFPGALWFYQKQLAKN